MRHLRPHHLIYAFSFDLSGNNTCLHHVRAGTGLTVMCQRTDPFTKNDILHLYDQVIGEICPDIMYIVRQRVEVHTILNSIRNLS